MTSRPEHESRCHRSTNWSHPARVDVVYRHLRMTEEWLPHEHIADSQGRDFDKQPWTH
jgi:hypothetical protein